MKVLIYFFLYSNGPSYFPQLPPVICPFSSCPNPGAGGPRVRCNKWFAPPGGPGKWLWAQGLLGADPWPQCFFNLHFLIHWRSPVLHTALGAEDSVVRKGLSSSLSTWGSQSSGEGTGGHHYHLEPWEPWGESQNWPGRERRKNWSGEEDSDSGSHLNVLSAPGGQGGSGKVP